MIYIKIRVFVLCLISIFIFGDQSLLAEDLDQVFFKAFAELSEAYVQKYPAGATKFGLSILPFSENSAKARNKGLGTTLRQILTHTAVRYSQVFHLVERQRLNEILNELALSQTGLIREKKFGEVGSLIGADAFIAGSVSEVADKFLVNLVLIDVKSGTAISSIKIEIAQKELLQEDLRLALHTISQYGLGINFQWSTAFAQTVEPAFLHFTDVFLNYRPALWLNLKLGGTAMSMNFLDKNVNADAVYPSLSAQSDPLIESLKYDGGNFTLISPYVGLEYNHMFNQKLSSTLGGSFIFGAVDLTQQYSDGVFFDDDDGLVHELKTFRIEQELDTIWLLRFESKTQYFVSPRMTIGLYLAYLIGPDLIVDRSVINDDYREFPHEGDPAPDEFKEKYFQMPSTILGNGKDVEDVSLSGFAVGIGFNFYF